MDAGTQRATADTARTAWIDFARGLGVILVVYGHVLGGLVRPGIFPDGAVARYEDGKLVLLDGPRFHLESPLSIAIDNKIDRFVDIGVDDVPQLIIILDRLTISADQDIAVFKASRSSRAIFCDRSDQYLGRIGDADTVENNAVDEHSRQQIHQWTGE